MLNEGLCDSITIIISDDSNVMCNVNLDEANAITLPTTPIPPNLSWRDVYQKEKHDLLGQSVLLATNIIKMRRIWLKSETTPLYIVNIVIKIEVSSSFKQYYVVPTIAKYSRLKWLNTRDLYRYYCAHVVNTPILFEIFSFLFSDLKKLYHLSYPSSIQEAGCYMEVTQDVFGKNTGNDVIDRLIQESPLKASENAIYVEFLKVIFPEMVMSGGAFYKIANRLGFNKQDCSKLFRAADLTTRGFITFNEYFGIFAAMEPTAKHVGMCGKARAIYIFRYLNQAADGKLTLKELKELVIWMRRIRNLSVDAASLEKELRETAISLGVTPSRAISQQDFVKTAEDLRFGGINNIFRSSRSLIKASNAPQNVSKNETKVRQPSTMLISTERSIKSVTQWELATHSMKIIHSGTDISMEPIFKTESFLKAQLESANITPLSRRKSLDFFGKSNVCNEMIEMTRSMALYNNVKSGNQGNKARDYTWKALSPIKFAQKLMAVCNMAVKILDTEPRLLEISTPLYILGDFHGNFGDMLFFEKMLWPLSPAYMAANILFLGDYIDRGYYGVELIAYLISHKVLYPKKFKMLRGNHEVRDVQRMFTFYGECLAKFGEQTGKQVWEAVNIFFDYLPIAAVVDNKLFCCHGGIPPPWLCPSIESISKIPKPLPSPDQKSPLAWEMLWNDPIKDDDITKEMGIELAANEGFGSNLKRGTAHVFCYNATMNFLNKNNFTHVIRAHELAFNGFNIFHKGKLIGVFSTSVYDGNNNEAACILAENYVLKVIRLNPSNLL